MNHRKGTNETSTAELKDWKRCDTPEKTQSAEKHQYIADKLISGPQAGWINMKYHLDAFTHEENIDDNEYETDLDSSSDSLPPLTESCASEDEHEYGKESKCHLRRGQKDINAAKSMDCTGGYRKC